jgi:uncharacterized protein
MKLAKSRTSGQILIKSYSVGQFRIGEELHPGSILLVGNVVFELNAERLEDLNEGILSKVFHAGPKVDVLLIGWGKCQGQLNIKLNNALEKAAIGVDVMNCGAACRTYNVLALEDRQVAAALFPL